MSASLVVVGVLLLLAEALPARCDTAQLVLVVGFQAQLTQQVRRLAAHGEAPASIGDSVGKLLAVQRRNLEHYTARHGYALRVVDTWSDDDLGSCGGMSYLRTLLSPGRRQREQFAWVLYVEGDALISRSDVDVVAGWLAKQSADVELVVAHNFELHAPWVPRRTIDRSIRPRQYRPNPSVLLVKNSAWSRSFFDEVCRRDRDSSSVGERFLLAATAQPWRQRIAFESHNFNASPLFWSAQQFAVHFDLVHNYGTPVCSIFQPNLSGHLLHNATVAAQTLAMCLADYRLLVGQDARARTYKRHPELQAVFGLPTDTLRSYSQSLW